GRRPRPPGRGEQLRPGPLAGPRGRPPQPRPPPTSPLTPAVPPDAAGPLTPVAPQAGAGPAPAAGRRRPPDRRLQPPRPGGPGRQVHRRHGPRRGPGPKCALLSREPAA